MTSFEKLLEGVDGTIAITPGDPKDSYLLDQITPDKHGDAEMPKKEDPLAPTEIALITQWITEGAHDDTPENARRQFDAEHPPTYTRPPVITALDYSPDGTLLAISGFHEVILQKIDSSGTASPFAKLIGLSERIESIRFSPDGTPPRRHRRTSRTHGAKSKSGTSRNKNSTCPSPSPSIPSTAPPGHPMEPRSPSVAPTTPPASSTPRLANKSSSWAPTPIGVLDTVFSTDGSHLISSGRDQTAKLTKVDEERFVDNITSITPGALKGGLASLSKQPERDEILVGGADGVPQIYRIHRITKRVIGDNSNLIRRYPAMPGRIWSTDYSADGKRIAAASSLDGKGYVNIYKSEFDPALPDDVKAIFGKTTPKWSADEKKRVEKYLTNGTETLHHFEFDAPVFALCFSPDGSKLTIGKQDGGVLTYDVATGNSFQAFSPVEITPSTTDTLAETSTTPSPDLTPAGKPYPAIGPDPLPEARTPVSLSLFPSEITIASPHAYRQLLVTAHYDNGDTADVTRHVTWSQPTPLLSISKRGLAHPVHGGNSNLTATFGKTSTTTPVTVSGLAKHAEPDWIRDVTPVISAGGCSAGTCHGSKDGKNGFKLSLRGYDPLFDVRAFTDDHGSRRTNLASPDDSLMLLKATGAVPHEGGQRMTVDSKDYRTVRDWIANGAKLEQHANKVQSIEITPRNPVVQNVGGRQQFSVVATYPNGEQRDVTAEAFLEIANLEVAEVDKFALVTGIRRGEAPILARYEGAYASTTLTVMGDRTGFQWADQPAFNEIDKFTAAKWKRMQTLPSGLATDTEFLRRVHLDLTGLPPSPEAIRAFLADNRDTRTKRDEIIDQLVDSPEFTEFWTNKWADLLQVNRKFLGPEGAKSLRAWIRNEVANSTPYDEFVRKILTSTGSNKDNPAASYFKILRDPEATMENTTHLFLATRFNCNKCHDHPFERWTQNQYYETAAFFARTDRKKDPAGGDKQIGKTEVEEGKPLYEIIFDKPDGEVLHERTKEPVPPDFPYAVAHQSADDATRRENLAAWMTAPENPLFARSYANRVWGYLFGTGIIEPIDDIRAGNPPSNPELLDWLTAQFLEQKFDARHLFRTICKSRTYQLSVQTNRWNEDDNVNFSHSIARRLPAEVLYDSIYTTTGSQSKFPGVPVGTRASALPDSGVTLPDGFLGSLGRPSRESACECDRVASLELGPIMALVSGPTVGNAISDPKNTIAKLAASDLSDQDLVAELYLNILNRPATPQEIENGVASIQTIPDDHAKLVATMDSFRANLSAELTKAFAERKEAITNATATLNRAGKDWAEPKKQLEAEKKTRLDSLNAQLANYNKGISGKLADWEENGNFSTSWTTLGFTEMTSSNGAKLEAQDDGSIFVTGPHGKTKYVLNADTDLTGITGLRLEALTDDRLPGKGPGRGKNFVLSELSITAAPKDKPTKTKPVPLQNAQADFSQKGYDVKTAIDGKAPANGNGWAISPQVGKDHSALFETKQDLGTTGGTRLSITLNQQYQAGKHSLGKFRLSLTTDPRPHRTGLPGEITIILAIPTAKRDDKQTKALTDYFRSVDPALHQLNTDLAEAKKPIPEPKELQSARKALDELLALPSVSPRLSILENDVALSASQTKNARLTAAQDLAWALINSPAFLFNY